MLMIVRVARDPAKIEIKTDAKHLLDGCHIRKQNPSPIGFPNSNSNADEPVTQHIGDQLFNSLWTFLDYIDQTIKWHPHYLRFTPILSKQSRLHRFFGQGLPVQPTLILTCSPARRPWHRMASVPVPPLNPDIKRHRQDTTWLPRLKLAHRERDVFPHKQNSKSRVVLGNRKTNMDFFPVVFRCFGCKSALVSPLGCKRWIGESMEKPAFWSLFVSDVKKFDRFQFNSVVKMNDLLRLVFIQYLMFTYYIYTLEVQDHCLNGLCAKTIFGNQSSKALVANHNIILFMII